MKKKLYFIPLVLLLLGLLVPVIYTNKDYQPDPRHQNAITKNNPDSSVSLKLPAQVQSQDSSGTVRLSGNPVVKASQSGQGRGAGGTGTGKAPAKHVSTVEEVSINKEKINSEVKIDKEEIKVGVAVVGKDGKPLFGPDEVRVTGENAWGLTALGALDATNLSYNTSVKWPDFVEAIAGQRNSGQSGWVYKVNSEVPVVSAAKRSVREGDRIIWWYSSSIGSPSPVWEILTASPEKGSKL